jgi:hypothetical protein
MKTSISRILVFAIIVAGSSLAKAENENFPTPPPPYDVSFAETARQGNGQIKVIRKGEGTWVFVEFTQLSPRRRAVQPGSPEPAPEEPKKVAKKLWINTQWIVTASEPKSEKQ